ncbi:unnamed protein product [Vitrella brassicaformis CCMP3155]|uniref:EF-hand domain-containing protein n=1 Tax=Vitrella brassicaformis (strain CCMP3155) TaxID=1169540 RepID=A0A0G4EFB8_VITBC|nr:unnamed protein product [Vitrella brassicaformis CCMP3155]|eukprot:CEL94442.1 unnamed protein product [Vitrella brassicaformis CCMP3155]
MHPSKDEDLMKLELDEILNAQDKDYDRKISWEEFRSDQGCDGKLVCHGSCRKLPTRKCLPSTKFPFKCSCKFVGLALAQAKK